ncbi:hypothetical protein LJR084_001876 [Variovorax sp. LjRoot84]|uniref:hypothetical protein n=1 Tax=Variovorax sp. LjRoot84 TaxID=3342340 RepID=UPI003ECE7136
MHTATISADIRAGMVAWAIVGAAFQDADPRCEECSHCSVEVEQVPYGEAYMPMTSSECTLGQRASDRPEQCPAYLEHVRQMAEEAAEAELS